MTKDPLRPLLFTVDTALLTSRCVVRRFREHEGGLLFDLVRASHEYLYEHYPDLPEEIGQDTDAAETFVRRRIAAWLLQEDFAFGIWENETTDLIGYLHIDNIDWKVPVGEMSFFLSPAHSHQGYMTEVVARALRFAFRQLELEKVYYKVLADNYPAQRLARKVGFTREGDLRNEFRKGSGILSDAIRFGFSRETYGE